MVYRTRQSLCERGRRNADRFDCLGCGTLVHAWAGAYDYELWTTVDLPSLAPE